MLQLTMLNATDFFAYLSGKDYQLFFIGYWINDPPVWSANVMARLADGVTMVGCQEYIPLTDTRMAGATELSAWAGW